MKKNSKTKANIIMIIAIVALVVGALLLQPKGEFEGSDGAAEAMITEIQPDYEPWFEPLIEPKSGEIESLLFTLQGSIGAAIIAYVIGFNKGKNKHVID